MDYIWNYWRNTVIPTIFCFLMYFCTTNTTADHKAHSIFIKVVYRYQYCKTRHYARCIILCKVHNPHISLTSILYCPESWKQKTELKYIYSSGVLRHTHFHMYGHTKWNKYLQNKCLKCKKYIKKKNGWLRRCVWRGGWEGVYMGGVPHTPHTHSNIHIYTLFWRIYAPDVQNIKSAKQWW